MPRPHVRVTHAPAGLTPGAGAGVAPCPGVFSLLLLPVLPVEGFAGPA